MEFSVFSQRSNCCCSMQVHHRVLRQSWLQCDTVHNDACKMQCRLLAGQLSRDQGFGVTDTFNAYSERTLAAGRSGCHATVGANFAPVIMIKWSGSHRASSSHRLSKLISPHTDRICTEDSVGPVSRSACRQVAACHVHRVTGRTRERATSPRQPHSMPAGPGDVGEASGMQRERQEG